jgi:hypothetical protein
MARFKSYDIYEKGDYLGTFGGSNIYEAAKKFVNRCGYNADIIEGKDGKTATVKVRGGNELVGIFPPEFDVFLDEE